MGHLRRGRDGMTSRQLAKVEPDELEYVAHRHNLDIEIDTANERAYVRVGDVTLYAELPTEVCS